MYADDKHLTYADKDVNIIQSCLNKHLLNISRLTEFMLIGSRQKLKTLTASPVLSINGTLVNQVSTSQSLGVLIDANLSWGSHIEKLALKKIASGIQCSYQTGQAICSPSNIASYLQSLDSAAFRLLQ